MILIWSLFEILISILVIVLIKKNISYFIELFANNTLILFCLILYEYVVRIFIVWNAICWSVTWTKHLIIKIKFSRHLFSNFSICWALVNVLNTDFKPSSECRPPAEQKSVSTELQVRLRRAATGQPSIEIAFPEVRIGCPGCLLPRALSNLPKFDWARC